MESESSSESLARELSVQDEGQGISFVTQQYNDLISNEDRRCSEAIRQVRSLETQTVSGEDVLRKRLSNLETQVRKIQHSINNVVSEVATLEDLQIGSDYSNQVTVKPMTQASYRLRCGQRNGPLILQVDYATDGDYSIMIGTRSEVSEENCVWKFGMRSKMTLQPQRAYDPDNKSALELKRGYHDSGSWQPTYLFLKVSSEAGCSFQLTISLPNEEKCHFRRKSTNGGEVKDFQSSSTQFQLRDRVEDEMAKLSQKRNGLKIISQ